MIFRPRAKHKLPKFPDTVIPTFNGYCQVLDKDARNKLGEALKQRMEELRACKSTNENLDLLLAELIYKTCQMLLELCDSRGAKEQALICGAVAYFAIEQDALSDQNFATGLHDDARVVNHVLEKLGIDDKFIDVE